MQMIVCGSGSSGNTIIIRTQKGDVLLDAGVTTKEVKKALGFNISNVKFVLCTHIHQDHAKYIKDYLSMGIPVYMPQQVKDVGKYGLGARVIPKFKNIKHDAFNILAFDVPHDGCENYSYILSGDGLPTMLYMTDAMYCRYNLKRFKFHTIIVECNYQDNRLDDKAENFNHSVKGHMNLNTCIDFLKANATDKLRHIVLCHLSKINADPVECQMAVCKSIPNVMVHVADKGLEVQL